MRINTDSASRRPPTINENTALYLYNHNHTHGKDRQRTPVRNTNHTYVPKIRTLAKTPRSACVPVIRRFPPSRASAAQISGLSTAIVPHTPGKIQPTHCLSVDSRWHTCSMAWQSEWSRQVRDTLPRSCKHSFVESTTTDWTKDPLAFVNSCGFHVVSRIPWAMAILWIFNTAALNVQASSVRKFNGLPCLCPTFDYSAEADLGGMKSYLCAAGAALR